MSERKRRRLTVPSDQSGTIEIVGPGTVLSERYELVRELGRGAMGIVYEAQDRKLEGLRVALKVLPPELASDKRSKKRLQKEAMAAIELTHTNILRLNDFEEDGNRAYLVMQFLDGLSLDEVLLERDEEKMSFDEVADIARQVGEALDYAHDKGIIHRDIKPANLMYHQDGKKKVVKVTDFGVAYQVKDSMTRLTGTTSSGTLLYMAPEQLRAEKPDARSDQYSLAVTIYELLTGEPPFSGPALSELIMKAEPKPIEGLPDGANEALLRALSKEPENRFERISDFAAAFADNCVPANESVAAPVSKKPTTTEAVIDEVVPNKVTAEKEKKDVPPPDDRSTTTDLVNEKFKVDLESRLKTYPMAIGGVLVLCGIMASSPKTGTAVMGIPLIVVGFGLLALAFTVKSYNEVDFEEGKVDFTRECLLFSTGYEACSMGDVVAVSVNQHSYSKTGRMGKRKMYPVVLVTKSQQLVQVSEYFEEDLSSANEWGRAVAKKLNIDFVPGKAGARLRVVRDAQGNLKVEQDSSMSIMELVLIVIVAIALAISALFGT